MMPTTTHTIATLPNTPALTTPSHCLSLMPLTSKAAQAQRLPLKDTPFFVIKGLAGYPLRPSYSLRYRRSHFGNTGLAFARSAFASLGLTGFLMLTVSGSAIASISNPSSVSNLASPSKSSPSKTVSTVSILSIDKQQRPQLPPYSQYSQPKNQTATSTLTDTIANPSVSNASSTVAKDLAAQNRENNETGEALSAPPDVAAGSSDSDASDHQTSDNQGDAMQTAEGQTRAAPTNRRIVTSLSDYAQRVNSATWSPNMPKNTVMTVRLQTLLDWHHASVGPIDGGWGMNSKKALTNFQVMQHLPATGTLDSATWQALTKNVDVHTPTLIEYTLTAKDVNTTFATIPDSTAAKAQLKGLYYQNIQEMLGERFHMDVRYLEKLNKGKNYTVGETITVINVGAPLNTSVDRLVANKEDKTLYAYHGDTLVATYPTTVGSRETPSPHGTFTLINKVKMPWYKATVAVAAEAGSAKDANAKDASKKVYMLAPGPNNPVGVVWMGLSKPSYGIHGSPLPEGISRQASHGCIRLTNWDVIELYANINKGATVELV